MNTETQREPARSRPPRTPPNANPTAFPDPAIDPFASLSLADIEAEIASRRAAAIDSRAAERDRLLTELRSIDREIAALEKDLRAHDREPTARQPIRVSSTSPTATVRNATPESIPSAPTTRVVDAGIAAESGLTIRSRDPVPVAKNFPSSTSQTNSDSSAPIAPTSDRPQPAPGARPQSLSRLVLAVIVEARPQAIALRDITTRVRARLDRERSDLDRAVPQVIRELRASGAIDATGFEEYAATEAGVRRLQG